MTILPSQTHRLAMGILTKTAIIAGDYRVADFPGTDNSEYRWEVYSTPSIATPYSVRRQSIGSKTYGQGRLNGSWTFGRLNINMMSYLYTELFEEQLTQQVTILMPTTIGAGIEFDGLGSLSGITVAIVCIMELPPLTQEGLNPRGRQGFSPVTVRWYNGYIN